MTVERGVWPVRNSIWAWLGISAQAKQNKGMGTGILYLTPEVAQYKSARKLKKISWGGDYAQNTTDGD
jgi:hypothetical protein